MQPAKATSVLETGESDGWSAPTAFFGEEGAQGLSRLVVSVEPSGLPAVHQAILKVAAEPISVLYRQLVDRQQPRPQGAPPRDFLAADVPKALVLQALQACSGLVYHDARCELWIRAGLDQQVVLDADGLICCYPDQGEFRRSLVEQGIEERNVETMANKDYVKHWFSAENDALEQRFIEMLGLVSVPAQG